LRRRQPTRRGQGMPLGQRVDIGSLWFRVSAKLQPVTPTLAVRTARHHGQAPAADDVLTDLATEGPRPSWPPLSGHRLAQHRGPLRGEIAHSLEPGRASKSDDQGGTGVTVEAPARSLSEEVIPGLVWGIRCTHGTMARITEVPNPPSDAEWIWL